MSIFTPATNDGSNSSPRLRMDLNLGTLDGLPSWSTAPRGTSEQIARAVRNAGFEGVQAADTPDFRSGPYDEAGLSRSSLGRANTPAEVDQLADAFARGGYDCATLHLGWGYEDEKTMQDLVDAVVAASDRVEVPLYVETHRSTITQDPWQTVRLVERNPGVRFNADFSHWYTGAEIIYGDPDHKFELLEPVFERVRYMHARVGNSGHIQVPLNDPSMKVAMEHYREMWTRSMQGFLRDSGPGDYLIFAPELLPGPQINYARLYRSEGGEWQEDSDRWQESLALVEIAKECFAEAERRVGV